MKTIFNKIIVASLILVAICSCEIEIPVPNELATNSKLVLYSEIKANADTVFFMMNRSVPIFNKNKNINTDIALKEVKIINDNVTYSFLSNEINSYSLNNSSSKDYRYYVVLNSAKIEEGNTYTLEVTTDKNEVISGTTTIPNYVPTSARLILDSTLYNDSFNNTSFYEYFYQLEFLDKANEKNYYAVGFTADFNQFEYNQQITSDLNFDGQKMYSEYTKLTYGSGFPISNYLFTIKAVDEHYYKHYKILINYAGENPFSEPQNLYSNVIGGLGCVYSSNLKPVTILR